MNKEYRDAFVAAQIKIGLPMQCRALRESRDWTQPKLAEEAGMSQPRISEIERPGERKLNLETLLRLASAFDVALQVRFVTFEQLVDDDNNVDLDNFYVAPFDKNMKQMAEREEKIKATLNISDWLKEQSKGISQEDKKPGIADALQRGDEIKPLSLAASDGGKKGENKGAFNAA